MQVKPLRFLQEREFQRVGGERSLKADVRIISAMHQDLEARVKEGLFLEDLYCRIHVVPLKIPPLRECREDIRLLQEALGKAQANHSRAPKLLGLSERMLRYTLKKYGLK